MAIDRIKNLSDAALVGKLAELTRAERANAARLREHAEDLRARGLPLPPELERALEDLDETPPISGVTASPDGTYQLDMRVSRESYSRLLAIGTLIDGPPAASAGGIVEWTLAAFLEWHREKMLGPSQATSGPPDAT